MFGYGELEQIEEHYGAQGLSIVGYFHGNERFDDMELGSTARNIGDHIYKYVPQAALLLVGRGLELTLLFVMYLCFGYGCNDLVWFLIVLGAV